MNNFSKYSLFVQAAIVYCVGLVILYTTIILFHNSIPFNTFNYDKNAHHYIPDQRLISRDNFSLINALAQYDAQWYIAIAEKGYPKHPQPITLETIRDMDGLKYAFFPMYPIILSTANIFFNNIQLTAFVVTNALSFLAVLSLLFFLSKYFDKKIAITTTLLLFLFPFSIFYRSYYTEGLYLVLLIWFAYYLLQKKFYTAALFVSLLNATRGNGVLFIPLLLFFAWKHANKKPQTYSSLLVLFLISSSSLFAWILFNGIQTGNPFYFLSIRSHLAPVGFDALVTNIFLILKSPWLPLHAFHQSQIEVFFIIITAFLLFFARKKLKKELWWIAFILCITPLFTKTIMSFTRYQTVSFPLFLYLAILLSNKRNSLITVLLFFILGLIITSLYFINWYWIG